MDVKEMVIQTIREQLLFEESKEIRLEMNFREDLSCDSLDCIELTMALEEKFDIEIPDEDAEKLVTVGDVITYIEAKIIK